jgi:uncharacterized protein (TIGR02118 family)
MIKVSILYPNVVGSRFDLDYYTNKHMPRSIELLGAHPGYRGVSVERGLSGTSDEPATYRVMAHFSFDSVDSFIAAFMPHAGELQGDIPNYTDVMPVIQFNEVLLLA